MRYLISGGTGFIGSNIIKRLLDNGDEVLLIIRKVSSLNEEAKRIPEENIFIYDNNDDDLDLFLKIKTPEIFIHLASSYVTQHKKEDIKTLMESNITYPTILTDAAIRNGCKKIINTGTSWQSFNNEQSNPACLYAATKEAFERVLDFYVKSQNINAITLRIFDTYGPNDRRKKLISTLIESHKYSTPLDMSPGEQEIDLVYIDDVVEAFLAATELLLKQSIVTHLVYGVSSENPITLKNLVGIIDSISNQNLKINWGARKYRDREVMYTWKNFDRLPNWAPKITIAEGLKKLIE